MSNKNTNWITRFLQWINSEDIDDPKERRHLERKKLAYYLRIIDANSRKALGQIYEITPEGLSVDLLVPLPLDTEYTLQLDLIDPAFDKLYITFKAKTKWLQPDPVTLGYYNMGFQITEINPDDIAIIEKIISLYAKQP